MHVLNDALVADTVLVRLLGTASIFAKLRDQAVVFGSRILVSHIRLDLLELRPAILYGRLVLPVLLGGLCHFNRVKLYRIFVLLV